MATNGIYIKARLSGILFITVGLLLFVAWSGRWIVELWSAALREPNLIDAAPLFLLVVVLVVPISLACLLLAVQTLRHGIASLRDGYVVLIDSEGIHYSLMHTSKIPWKSIKGIFHGLGIGVGALSFELDPALGIKPAVGFVSIIGLIVRTIFSRGDACTYFELSTLALDYAPVDLMNSLTKTIPPDAGVGITLH